MHRVSEALATKLDTLAYRVSLLNEVARLKAKGRYFPRNAARLLWQSPTRYDDFVEMINFVDNNGPVDLIDIGANHGTFARDFNLFYPNNGRILCFEPNPGLTPVVRETLRAVPNVELFEMGLGEKEETLELVVPLAGDGLGSFRTLGSDANRHYQVGESRTYRVPVERLDDVAGAFANRVITKIDTQGFEEHVIKGGAKTLSKCEAVLLECSFAPMHGDGAAPSFNACNTLLAEMGFAPVVFQRYGRKVNAYAFERDVLYVRETLTSKVFHANV